MNPSHLDDSRTIPETAARPVAEEEGQQLPAYSGGSVWTRMRAQRASMVCLAVIVVFVLGAIAAPWLAPHSPDFQFDAGLSSIGAPEGSSGQFLLGTDTLGRDVLSRLLFGARVSLTVGILATGLMVTIGVALGSMAGFFGGWMEIVIMRLVDIMLAFPVILLGLATAAVFGPSLTVTIAVIALSQWMYLARIVYGMVQTLKELEFVTAARAVGASDLRIVTRHIFPHLGPVVITYATLGIGGSILLEATLSFLNAGVPPPTPTWGGMISSGLTYYYVDPALVLYPGIVLAIAVLAFIWLGDMLNRALAAR